MAGKELWCVCGGASITANASPRFAVRSAGHLSGLNIVLKKNKNKKSAKNVVSGVAAEDSRVSGEWGDRETLVLHEIRVQKRFFFKLQRSLTVLLTPVLSGRVFLEDPWRPHLVDEPSCSSQRKKSSSWSSSFSPSHSQDEAIYGL